MRVTDQMLFASLAEGLNRTRTEHLRAAQRAQTGQRVASPSDDPTAAARASALDGAIGRLDAMEGNATRTRARLGVSDAALGDMGLVLMRAREIAIMGNSAGYSARDRVSLATEVASLRSHLVSLGNTEVEGVYVFAGFTHDTPPFAPNGAYLGDANVMQVEVAPDVLVPSGSAGAGLIAAGVGVDVFAQLDALEAALLADDEAGIRATIDTVEASREQVSQVRTSLGTALSSLEQADTTRAYLRDNLVMARADAVEMDSVTAMSDLLRAETQLSGAVASASHMIELLRSIRL